MNIILTKTYSDHLFYNAYKYSGKLNLYMNWQLFRYVKNFKYIPKIKLNYFARGYYTSTAMRHFFRNNEVSIEHLLPVYYSLVDWMKSLKPQIESREIFFARPGEGLSLFTNNLGFYEYFITFAEQLDNIEQRDPVGGIVVNERMVVLDNSEKYHVKLFKKEPKYRYRLELKQGKYTDEQKQYINDFLIKNPTISCKPYLKSWLTRNDRHHGPTLYYSAYLELNDESLIPYIMLMIGEHIQQTYMNKKIMKEHIVK